MPDTGRTRGLRFAAPRIVEVVDVDLPGLEPGDVEVRTLFSGISSGSEMLAYRGEIDPSLALDERFESMSGTFSFPFRYGYSCVGIVERSLATTPQGTTVFGFHPHQARFVQPQRDVVIVDGIGAREATLFPLVETALQLCLDVGAVEDRAVAVTGMGAVGLLTALLLARRGASVLASEPVAWRRSIAAELGIETVPPDDLHDRVMHDTRGRGATHAIEVSGAPSALAQILELLAHEGEVVVGSWYGTRPVTLPLGGAFHRRRLVIRSSQVSTIPSRLAGEWTIERRREAVRDEMLSLPLDRLATHVFPFDDAPGAFRAVDDGIEGLVHAALRYDGG